jgi:hypothetical protein
MRKSILVVMTAILLLALATAAMAADPFVGTWKLNVAKSKSSSQRTWPQSSTVKIEEQDHGLKIAEDRVLADGKTPHMEFSEKFDGKDYPDPSSPGLASAYTRVDANTVLVVFKRDGKEVGRSRDVVSKDGRTITRTQTGKNSNGQEVNVTMVFDKQ